MMAKTRAGQAQATGEAAEKTVVTNRQARHDYFIVETVEAGLALTGTEIKSIRAGRLNLRDAYARVDDGEAWLIGMHVSPYEQAGGYFQHDPLRPRKLLLHRREIEKLEREATVKGMTLVVTRIYWKNGRIKFEIGVAKGKKLYDKRETEMRRTIDRETQAEIKERTR